MTFVRVVAVALAAMLALALLERDARAVPRFAERTGMPCIACHVNPSGGGMRNDFGRNVYERQMLPVQASLGALAIPSGVSSRSEADASSWFQLGTDLRTAYVFSHTPDPTVKNTNTFFLMEGNLYVSARAGEHLTLYVSKGIYNSFEAFGMLQWPRRSLDTLPRLYVKAGRFVPAYGIKDPNHTLPTRESIGFAQVSKDSGVEVGGYLGPASLQVAVVNGVAADEALDTSGTDRSRFEKAVVARGDLRARLGRARLFAGGSLYFDDNAKGVNPLAPPDVVAPSQTGDVARGVNEVRTGPFGGISLGRLGALGEVDYVQDSFNAGGLRAWSGYVAFGEVSVLPVQGVDVLATYEFKDPDTRVGGDATHRLGGVLEVYPMEYVELRFQYRYTISALGLPLDRMREIVAYLHVFL